MDRQASDQAYREAARNMAAEDAVLEIHDNAQVSKTDEGAYVQAWIKVPNGWALDYDYAREIREERETKELNTAEIDRMVKWAKDQDNVPMVAGGHHIARIEDGHYVCECDRVGGPVKPGDPPLEELRARGF